MARIVVPGVAHHVTQRGNRRADIFETDDDREAYLRFLKEHCEKRGLSVWAYCLMSNHVHLVVVPEKASSLSEGVARCAHGVSHVLQFAHAVVGTCLARSILLMPT